MQKNIKTKEALLQAYKKSNKDRRIVLISKAGYKTETEYLNFLNGVKVVAKAKTALKVKAVVAPVKGKKN